MPSFTSSAPGSNKGPEAAAYNLGKTSGRLCPERGHRRGTTEAVSASRRASNRSRQRSRHRDRGEPTPFLQAHRLTQRQNIFTVTIISTVIVKCRGPSSPRAYSDAKWEETQLSQWSYAGANQAEGRQILSYKAFTKTQLFMGNKA